MSSTFHKERRWHQLRKLTDVSRALTYPVSLDQVLELTVLRAVELVEADRAVLLLTDEQGVLTVRAQRGVDPAACAGFQEPLRESLSKELMSLLRVDGHRFVGVPLVVRGEVVGLLAVAGDSVPADVEEDEWVLSALADQAALAVEKARLNEIAASQERLIGIVSHDLRNPIAAVSNAAELLLRHDELDEEAVRTVLRIQSSATRATRMVGDLLDFTEARLTGGIRLDPRPGDVHEIVLQVAEDVARAHPDRDIDLVQAGDGRGVWDAERLGQVAENLVTNAVRYSPAGSKVLVESRGEGTEVVIRVRNGGDPIPASRLPHVFEPMQRGTSDQRGGARSVGLGLYIVQQIVEAHHGEVEVSSNSTGTIFTVSLPRQAPSVDGSEA